MPMLLMIAVALLFCPRAAMGQAEEGLVVHYTFDEGEGEVVRDKSGHGVEGQLVHRPEESPKDYTGKAQWVQEKNRKVLRFDGNTHIQAGMKANSMMGQRGSLEVWCFPEQIRGGLISWFPPHTPGGDYWPEQSLVLSFWTYRDSRLIGVLANGVEATHSSWFLHVVEKGKWLHLLMTYDGTNIHLYENGKRVQTIPQDDISPNFKEAPLRIGRSEGLGYVNFVGRMAEVRIYNRTLNAEEVGQHFAAGVKQLGIELPRSVGLTTRLDARQGELTVLCDLVKIPSLPQRPGLFVTLRDVSNNVLQDKTAPIPANERVVPVTLPTASLAAGLYELSVAVKDMGADKTLGETTTVRWFLPEVAQLVGAPAGRKVLNNLVTQLATVDDLSLKEYQEISFVNPRKGWVFVSATAQVANRGLVTVGVDSEKKDAAPVHLSVDKPSVETMRFLSAGEHKLCLWHDTYSLNRFVPPGEKQSTINRLIVRAVPAMMYCGWPGGS
ncbi:MAG: LamG domain-containing protein, partial [Armatimonadetes bacterium]|nr:LamG domain-containing protein [Armatimonadota bacterium]